MGVKLALTGRYLISLRHCLHVTVEHRQSWQVMQRDSDIVIGVNHVKLYTVKEA